MIRSISFAVLIAALSSCSKNPNLGSASSLATINLFYLEDSQYSDYTSVELDILENSSSGSVLKAITAQKDQAPETEIKIKEGTYYFKLRFKKNETVLLDSEKCSDQDKIHKVFANKENKFSLSICPVDGGTPVEPKQFDATVQIDVKIGENGDQVTSGGSLVNSQGQLTVVGNRIHGSKSNRAIQVKGMSFFWSNWGNKWYTSSYVDKMVDEYKVSLLRAAYGVGETGVPMQASDTSYVDTVVNQSIKRGIYVIIDWHSHGAHLNPSEAIKFFSSMAQKYGQYDNVIFEIYNEPVNRNEVSWQQVKSYAEQVIPIIRQYSDNLIVVGSPHWSQDADIAADNPVAGTNIAYTLHFYAASHKQDLRQKAEAAMNKGLALFVTEWGTVGASGDGNPDATSTREWTTWLDQHMISSAGWSIHDKNEGASFFLPGTEQLSVSGQLMRDYIAK